MKQQLNTAILISPFFRSPYLFCLPFLAVYFLIVWAISPPGAPLHDDEFRYWQYADNLSHGFYAGGGYFLWSGPGYPLVLLPFKILGLPAGLCKLLNPIFLYLALVFLYKSFLYFLPKVYSLIGVCLAGCYYPNLLGTLPNLYSEPLAFFLVCLFMFYSIQGIQDENPRASRKKILFAGLTLSFLALTKIIFGYLILGFLVLLPVGFLIKNMQKECRKLFQIHSVAMAFCLPYLFYTWSLTGSFFYWGDSGGLSLYWMSSPHETELGDWHMLNLVDDPSLKINHQEFVQSIQHLDGFERDLALKEKAFENIKNHKVKFLKNWISNCSRLVFSHPLSFLPPSNGFLFYLVPNIFFIVLGSLSFLLHLIYRSRFGVLEFYLFLFPLIYLFGVSLLSCYARFFYLAVPPLMLWIAVVLYRSLQIRRA